MKIKKMKKKAENSEKLEAEINQEQDKQQLGF